MTTTTRQRRGRCRYCGGLYVKARGGLTRHERKCPENPDRAVPDEAPEASDVRLGDRYFGDYYASLAFGPDGLQITVTVPIGDLLDVIARSAQ